MIIKRYAADFKNLNEIRDLICSRGEKWGLTESQVYEAQLATDEAASNIIEHAYENPGENTIEVRVAKEFNGVSITLIDSGRAYKPDFIKIPIKDGDVSDAEIGGLGLFFIHRLMDEVKYAYDPKRGNILKLKKYFSKDKQPKKSDPKDVLSEVFRLGRSLIGAATLDQRKDLVVETIEGLLGGGADLWLDESLIRLPWQVESVFPAGPVSEQQLKAIKKKKITRAKLGDEDHIAVPIYDQDGIQGVIEAWRSEGGRYSAVEERVLIGVAQTISIAFSAWHRVELEQWRMRQLNIVQRVSAELIREPDIQKMCEKAIALILSGFKVYAVGIFTLSSDEKRLDCQAAIGGATRESGSVRSLTYSAELGIDPAGRAVTTGELIQISDGAKGKELELVELPDTRSRLCIPLKTEEKVIGVLDIHSDKIDGFHHVDILVMSTLADNIALAIEGSLLLEKQRQQASRSRLITEVTKQITSFLDLRQLMDEVGRLIHEKLGYPYVHLFTVHHNRRQIRYEGGAGERSAVLEGYVIHLDEPEGFISWTARNAKTINSSNVVEDERYLPSPLPPYNTVSEITVPLINNGQVNGILDIQSDSPNAFSEDDQTTLETLADTIATAIRNAELYHSEQWRRQSAESLREVAGLLSKNARVEQVLDAVLTELERNLPSDLSSIWLIEEGELVCAASHGVESGHLEQIKFESEEAYEHLVKMMLSERTIIRDARDPYGPAALAGRYKPDHSAIFVPLLIGNNPLGVLTLTHHTSGRYGHEAAAMTSTYASYASVAIENARLYDSAQEQAYASATLLQIAQAVVSLNSLDEIFQTITRALPILVGVDKVAIFEKVSDTEIRLAQNYGLNKEAISKHERIFKIIDFPMIYSACETGEIMISKEGYKGEENWVEVAFDNDRGEGSVYTLDDRLLIAIPLILKNENFGVLLVEEADGGKRFRDRRFEILTGVAQQITLAIQNENYQNEKIDRERLETEVSVARQIQKTFLPATLNIDQNWQIAAEWLTAKQMGGDLYDLIDLGDDRYGIFIADVADKGIGAALFMALTRTLVRVSTGWFSTPSEMVAWLNKELAPDCENGMFVTAFLGILNAATGVLTYVNAGHNPPILVHNGGTTALTRTGIALGAMEDAVYEQRQVELNADDLLCLYTDGITEAFSPQGEMFGDDRLRELLASSAVDQTAVEVMDDVLFAVREMTNNSALSDDISIMVIKKSSST